MESVAEEQTRVEEEPEEMDDDEEEEEEEIDDEEEDMEEEEEEEGDHMETVTVGRRSGRGLTLKTLLKEGILEPGPGSMTINYLGNKFKGDLLPDGRIRSQETNKIFGTPSAWAIYCKKIVNPDKKSGCGWASVRYRGKKLDSYKNNWFRQKRLEYEKEEEEMEEEESGSESEETSPHEQEIIEFDILGNRNPNHDPSTMIELTTFQSLGRMQPFNITMSSSAMAVIDVHAHMTTSEIVGYLAGQWDVNNHNLIVSHAFPVRCRLGDTDKGPSIEQELYAEMARLKLSLVGWYHTHPHNPPLPSLRDIDSQLDYEMKMKGYNDASYTPVLGIIVSPYQKSSVSDKGIPHANGNASGFWVMPPPENKPLEYGRPMSMQFTVVQDAFIPKEALLHMSDVVKFYKDAPDSITLANTFEDKITYWHKLKSSLRGRVPKDHFSPLIDFLTKIIDEKLPEDDPIPIPVISQSVTVTPIPSSSMSPLHLVPSSLPDSKGLMQLSSESLLGMQDFESSIVSIKPTMSSNACALSSLSEHFKEKDMATIAATITPIVSTGMDKFFIPEEPVSITVSKSDGRTPPPKAYSPIFQLPLPPLFPLDSNKSTAMKESLSIKNMFPQLNLLPEEKKSGYASPSKSSSPLIDSGKLGLGIESDSGATDLTTASKSDILSELALKLRKKESLEISTSSGKFLDFSMGLNMGMNKDASEKTRKEDSQRSKEHKEDKMGPIDIPAWFAQAKLMQEAFSLPPHERDHPFAREMPPLFPSDFLSPQWNPTAAAAALHLSRDATSSASIYKSPLSFPRDNSKPTYHSDVPLLLKKPQEESTTLTKVGSESQDPKNSRKFMEGRDFRVPKDVKDTREKDYREQRDRSPRDARDHRDPRDKKVRDEIRESREIRSPRDYRDFEKDSREMKEMRDAVSPKELAKEQPLPLSRDVRSALFRDYNELKLNPRDSSFSSKLREVLDLRDRDSSRSSREGIHNKESGVQSPDCGTFKEPKDISLNSEVRRMESTNVEAIGESEERCTKKNTGDSRKGIINLRDPGELINSRDVLNYIDPREHNEPKSNLIDSSSLNELRNLIEKSNFSETVRSSGSRNPSGSDPRTAIVDSMTLGESLAIGNVAADLRMQSDPKKICDSRNLIDLRLPSDKRNDNRNPVDMRSIMSDHRTSSLDPRLMANEDNILDPTIVRCESSSRATDPRLQRMIENPEKILDSVDNEGIDYTSQRKPHYPSEEKELSEEPAAASVAYIQARNQQIDEEPMDYS